MANAAPTLSQSKQDPLSPVKSAALKGNPLRADISWQLLSIEAVVVFAVGIFALVNESSALRNVVTLIGILLLVDGLSCAIATREKSSLRLSGIGIALLLAAWGVIVLIQASSDSNSMGLFGAAAIIVGVGLAGLAFLRWRRATSTRGAT